MLLLVIAFGLRSQESNLGINRPDVVWDNGELYMWVDEETTIRIADILDYHDIIVADLDHCQIKYARLKSINQELIEAVEETSPELEAVLRKLDDIDDGVDVIVDEAVANERRKSWGKIFRTIRDVAVVAAVAVLSFQVGQSGALQR